MIGVVVGTFGSKEWEIRGEEALRSLEIQTVPYQAVHSHKNSLMEARNSGADYLINEFGVEWLCFLDADDSLHFQYLEKMEDKIKELKNVDHLIQPTTALMVDGEQVEEPYLIPAKPIQEGNWMVIGTLVKSSTFKKVEGFADWPIYEDWDLWIRCSLAGAKFATQPESTYLISRSEGSRNNQDRKIQEKYYSEIKNQYKF